jgi:hypothetical protein
MKPNNNGTISGLIVMFGLLGTILAKIAGFL